jgi:hypothetical protein
MLDAVIAEGEATTQLAARCSRYGCTAISPGPVTARQQKASAVWILAGQSGRTATSSNPSLGGNRSPIKKSWQLPTQSKKSSIAG